MATVSRRRVSCHGEVLLVDCGLGVLGDVLELPARRIPLADALAAAGCSADEVSTVVVTRLDPDRLGGIVGGSYPDALVPALPVGGMRLEGVSGDAENARGARLRPAPGHRVGHAVLELGGGPDRFVFLADTLHARKHMSHPDWDQLHDAAPDVTRATRRRLVDELAGSGAVVGCSHVGTLGTIERGGVGAPVWIDAGPRP